MLNIVLKIEKKFTTGHFSFATDQHEFSLIFSMI